MRRGDRGEELGSASALVSSRGRLALGTEI